MKPITLFFVTASLFSGALQLSQAAPVGLTVHNDSGEKMMLIPGKLVWTNNEWVVQDFGGEGKPMTLPPGATVAFEHPRSITVELYKGDVLFDDQQLMKQHLVTPISLSGTHTYYYKSDSHRFFVAGLQPKTDFSNIIPLSSAVKLKCSSGSFLGGNSGDYATMGSSGANYLFSGGGSHLANNGIYRITLGGKKLYETAKGNAGFTTSNSGKTEQWKVVKVAGSKGPFLSYGDTVKIYNVHYSDNFLCDYQTGWAAAGNYSRPNQWTLTKP